MGFEGNKTNVHLTRRRAGNGDEVEGLREARKLRKNLIVPCLVENVSRVREGKFVRRTICYTNSGRCFPNDCKMYKALWLQCTEGHELLFCTSESAFMNVV